MTEKLALEKRFRQSGAVEHHERRIRPVAGVMDRLGRQLLAGARLALQQHGGIGRRHARYHVQHVPVRWRTPNKPLGMNQSLHGRRILQPIHEAGDTAFGIVDGRHPDALVSLAFGGTMEMKAALTPARLQTLQERTILHHSIAALAVTVCGLVQVFPATSAQAAHLPPYAAESWTLAASGLAVRPSAARVRHAASMTVPAAGAGMFSRSAETDIYTLSS